jgi:hypothetical protein
MPDMDGFLAEFDRNMEAIARGTPFGQFQPATLARGSKRGGIRAAERDRLARKALRAMYVGAAFHELPEQGQRHPGMQERLRRHAREVDEAVFGTTEVLEKLSAKDREQLRQFLRRDRALPMRVAEVLDEKAGGASVPTRRRRMLRQAMVQVSFRLRHQNPSLFLDECVGKVRRVAKRKGYSEELQRRLATQAAESTFWELADAKRSQVGFANTVAAGSDSEGWIPVEPDPEPPPKTSSAGSGAITAGLWMLGIGLGVGLLGVALVAAENLGGLFLLTAAVLLLAAGLITLVVGLIIKATSDSPDREPEQVEESAPGDWQTGVPPPSPSPAPSHQRQNRDF